MWQQVENQLSRKLPFVVYRKPKAKNVTAILQNDDRLHIVSDFSESGFVFSSFDTKNSPILIQEDKTLNLEFSNQKTSIIKENSVVNTESISNAYIELLEKAIHEIESGKFKKVVLSRVLLVSNNTAVIVLLRRILSTYTKAFCYLWYHPKVGVWLGATPEILLQSKGESITTMSLAGTMKFEEGNQQKWGSKELNEQTLVTEFIVNELQGKVSEIQKSKTETIKAGDLLHLRTRITGVLKDTKLKDIVEVLHPTPAICGLPKKAALDFILKNEGYNREFYGGYLGELNRDIKKSSTLYVNLRCMQKIENQLKIYVGGGVTNDSDPKNEWQETVNKSGTMLRVLCK